VRSTVCNQVTMYTPVEKASNSQETQRFIPFHHRSLNVDRLGTFRSFEDYGNKKSAIIFAEDTGGDITRVENYGLGQIRR
jgi:hypothetical protein